PASSNVGTSGSRLTRLAVVTASARTAPSRISGAAGGSEEKATGVWPPSTDWIIGPPPWNGTAVRSSFRASLKSSPERGDGVPAPGVAWLLYLPLRTSSTNSVTEFAGTDLCTTSTLGVVAAMVTGSKSLTGSYGTLP